MSGDQRAPFVNYYEHTAAEDARHTVTDRDLPLYPGHTEEEEGIDFTQDRLRVSLTNYGYPLAHNVLGGRYSTSRRDSNDVILQALQLMVPFFLYPLPSLCNTARPQI